MGISVYTSLLIKDYKRKAGEIKALRKELREAARIILTKQDELGALETVIKSREPSFDPASTKPIATYPKVLGLPWNRLTTTILSILRDAYPQTVSMDVIADYVIEQRGMQIETRAELQAVRSSVRYRLKSLAREKRVIRHHDQTTRTFGVWSLPSGDGGKD